MKARRKPGATARTNPSSALGAARTKDADGRGVGREAAASQQGILSREGQARSPQAAAPGAGLDQNVAMLMAMQRNHGNAHVLRLIKRARKRPEDQEATDAAAASLSVSMSSLETPAPAIGRDAPAALAVPAPNALPAAGLLQRDPETATASNMAQLDEMLDAFDTPEDEVIDLLGRMTATEKRTVIAGYRDKIANALDVSEMKRAIANLGTDLPTSLDWLQKASLATSLIDYDDIRALITAAPQSDRDMLKNGRWQSFFFSVCDNTTILTAMQDLNFDLVTKLDWIRGEASALLSLDLATLRPLLTSATPADKAAVSTAAWQPFWTDVCDNETMSELVDILFTGLTPKLEWMAEEGSELSLVRGKLGTASPEEKLALFANDKIRSMMVDVCNDDEMIAFVLDLGGDWAKWRPWVEAEGASFVDLARQAISRNLIVADYMVIAYANQITAGNDAEYARHYLRYTSDANLAIIKAHPMTLDIINDAYGGDAEDVIRALNGELAREDMEVTTDETLLTGDPTAGPFKEMEFGGDKRFTITCMRDRVDVDVGVEIEAESGDDRAEELLADSISTWKANIEGAWDNVFQITNGDRTIPMRFHANLDGGPNKVTAHSGVWVWPKLNAGNWFVPDDNVPGQKDAVAKAPIHEFGHLIGNLDEYNISSAHYITITGKDPTTDPNAVAETDTEGTTRYTNSASIMGSGTQVLKTHVDHILDWVNGNLRIGEAPFRFV